MRTKEVTNDELKKIAALVISEANLDKVSEAVKNVSKRLGDNSEYVALTSKVAKMEHDFLMKDRAYKEYALLNVTTLARAAKRMLGANIPTDFENTKDFEALFQAHVQKLDTISRLTSFVIAVQKRFKETKVVRTKQTKPYSFKQKRIMLMAFYAECSTYKTKDELREAFDKGIEI